ncbi:MAG: putative hydro-lyase [Phycisphaerae bacterium]
MAQATGEQIRALCRSGEFDRPTAGVALGYAQANLVVLRSNAAREFEEFCRLNPRPCPVMEVTRPGHYVPIRHAPGADLRTDLPRYRVLQRGACVDTPTSICDHWDAECVAFLIGCSFTFEAALLKAGIPVRHIETDRNVPMYRTNVSCQPAGRFGGPLVVSMRPMTLRQAEAATAITDAYPHSHGAPILVGHPEKLGIADLNRPDYGEAVSIDDDEMPVFWACGVTPIEIILRAGLDFAVTHEPGHMFVTDALDPSLRRL